MSRQQTYQEWHRLAGLCHVCPIPVVPGCLLCAKHLEAHRLANRKRFGCKPWKPGGRGRPPKDRGQDVV